ncbi:MAG: hypothetical protein EXR72_13725 [Myxococcales bacterium]|nr:hypothetical protein [Myxococcales bacterium]
MVPKRVIAIAADRALGRRMAAAAMAAGGASEAIESVAALHGRFDADVYLYAATVADDPALAILLAALPERTHLVPLIPSCDLGWSSRLLGNRHIPAVLVNDPLDVPQLTATVTKLLYGDLFGIEKAVPWGVRIHSLLVGDYQEKARAIAGISEFAGAMGVRRKYRESIEQVIDELLMNALYDAPVDERGKPVFADVPVKDRITMRVEEKAVVQYACDGDRFCLSVRDAYGTLHKPTILAFLEKCLHTQGDGQIDRKASGAGLGLYLIANAASQVAFHIFPGTATEVVCSFDLTTPRLQLRSFGIFEDPIAQGKPSTEPRQTVRRRRRDDLIARGAPAPLPRSLTVALTSATLLLLVAVTLVALPYFRKPSPAALVIETDPRGATVYVDGRSQGPAAGSLRVAGLEAGRTYAVRASMTGRSDEERLVSAAGGEQPLRLALAKAASGVLAIESDPAGAELLLDGNPTGKTTPAVLDLAPGAPGAILLRRAGFSEGKLTVAGPAPGERAVYRTALALSPDVAALSLAVTGEGGEAITPTVTIDGLPLMPPGRRHEALLKPKLTHLLTVAAPGHVTHTAELRLVGGQRRELHVALLAGGALTLRTNVPLKLAVDGKLAGTAPVEGLGLAPGRHAVMLFAQNPLTAHEITIAIEKGRTIERKIDFGTVVVSVPGVVARPAGTKRGAALVGLPAGRQSVTLVGPGGEERTREVEVPAGGRVTIDHF